MSGLIRVQAPGAPRQRKMRSPHFPIVGTMKPYGLYPLWIHPVLPGETVEKIKTRMRCVSHPIANPLAGCWFEMWFVYVKLTDIAEELTDMFITDTMSTTGYTEASDQERYFSKSGQIAWTRLATERVHDTWFMDEDETARSIDGVRKTRMDHVSWAQNCVFEQADETPNTTDIGELGEQLTKWQMLQQMSMSEISYDDYLKQYGVKADRLNPRQPEILRYARKWVLPKNAIEPSDGSPSSAWAWYEDIELNKAKRFDEPGFLLCLTTARPKMYQKHLTASMVGELWGFSDWFPVYNLDDPTSGVKTISTASSIFHADHRTDVGDKDILYDHRDLLMHGEQFINDYTPVHSHPMSAGMLAQDASDAYEIRGLYADDTSIDALFSGTNKGFFYEGMATIGMKGHLTDHTPTG